jgi:hypothetical protein
VIVMYPGADLKLGDYCTHYHVECDSGEAGQIQIEVDAFI